MVRGRASSSNHLSLVQHGGAGVVAICAGPLSCLLLISHSPAVPLSSHLPPPRSLLLYSIVHSPSAPFPFCIHTFQSLNHPCPCIFLLQLVSHLLGWMLSFYTNPPLSRCCVYPPSSKAPPCPNIDRHILPPCVSLPGNPSSRVQTRKPPSHRPRVP